MKISEYDLFGVYLKFRNSFHAYLLIAGLLLSSCIANNQIHVALKGSKKIEPFNISVSNVQILNHQIIITGSNLTSVSNLQINEGSNITNLQIESKNSTSIIANTLSNVSFAAGKVFDFVLSNANASSIFTVNFSLCDSVLGGKGFACLVTPNDKDVLSYDASTGKWIPRNVNGLNYKGTLDASLGANPIGSPAAGDYFVISTAGTINSVNYIVGDWIVYNADDLVWQQVSNSKDVLSVFGRKGNISAKKGDYILSKMGDVDFSTLPVLDQVLKYNGSSWMPATVSSTSANSAGSAALPGYSFVGNANTGLFSPSANQLAISNNGVETFRVSSSGFIGIGTTNPSVSLDVAGVIKSSGTIYTNGGMGIFDNLEIGNNNTIGNTYFTLRSNNLERVRIDGLGNVGIGTTMPGAKLEVKGDLRLSGVTSGYVGFAPAASAGATTYTLPTIQGNAGQVLSTDGVLSTPTLSWITPGSTASVLTGLSSTTGNISAADSILGAFGKLLFTQTDYVSKSADQTINGNLAINSLTGFLTVPTPIGVNDAVNKSYVDGLGLWIKSGSDVYRSSGNVGIGTTSASGIFEVQGGTSSSGNATNISLVAQNGKATGATNGGNINLTAGMANGAGTPGWVNVNNVGINFAPGSVNGANPPAGFTGVYSTGANRLDFATNGINRISLLSSGFVVMGSGSTSIIGNSFRDFTTNLNGLNMDANNTTLTTNNLPRLSINNSGNVGIGTTAPGSALDVNGQIRTEIGGSAAAPSFAYGSNGTGIYFSAPATMVFAANSAASMRITQGGMSDPTTGNGYAIQAGNSTATFPTLVPNRSAATTGIGSSVSGNISFITAGTTKVEITNSGNLGIGTTLPSYTLDVNGSIAGTSAYNNLSDERFKEKIIKIPNAFEKLLSIDGVFYNFKTKEFPDKKFSNRRELGVIAQKVEKVFPEAITFDQKGFRSVAYSMLIAPIIESLKEIKMWMIRVDKDQLIQKREIASLKIENELMKKDNKKLKEDNELIKKEIAEIKKVLLKK